MNGSQWVVNQRTRIRLKLESSEDSEKRDSLGQVIDSRQLTSSRSTLVSARGGWHRMNQVRADASPQKTKTNQHSLSTVHTALPSNARGSLRFGEPCHVESHLLDHVPVIDAHHFHVVQRDPGPRAVSRGGRVCLKVRPSDAHKTGPPPLLIVCERCLCSAGIGDSRAHQALVVDFLQLTTTEPAQRRISRPAPPPANSLVWN